MIATIQPCSETADASPSIGGYIKRDGKTVLVVAVVTVVLELGAYFLGLLAGASELGATLGALAVCVLWTIIAAGPLAASGCDFLGSLLRGGSIADSSALAMLVIWLASPYVSLIACVKIYCTLLALAFFASVLAWSGRSQTARYAMGMLGCFVMAIAASTPFWTGGLIAATDNPTAQVIVDWVVAVNPFYSICEAVAEQTGFIWHQGSLLYRITRIGDYVSPAPPHWYASPVIFGIGAFAIGLVGYLVGRLTAGRRDNLSAAP